MGGLGIDARDILEITDNVTVTIGDGNSTGNLQVGQDAFVMNKLRTAEVGQIDAAAANKDFRIAGDSNTFIFAGGITGEGIKISNTTFEVDIQNNLLVSGNTEIRANLAVDGNAYVGTYLAINNTNPAATHALVVDGNIRIGTGGSLIFPDGTSQSTGSTAAVFPTGDYGLLDSANASSDAFGQVTAGLDTFDMLSAPVGSLGTEDLGALS